MFSFIAFCVTSFVIAQNFNPRHPAWTDSFEANGFCWCNSTNFDHNLDEKTLEINGTDYNIVAVCDELENHPSYRSFQNGDAPYNDIQCGNGPANDAIDETGCPGRTDLGPGGCFNIGPTFDMEWLASRSRFGGDNEVVTPTPPTVTAGSNVVHIVKRNAPGFALDGDRGGENRQNIYLWSENENNVNQQWVEIDRGNGYFSYQKRNTNFCIDGGRGGSNAQNIYLFECSNNNQNQHWEKIAAAGGSYRLVKRNASSFAIDGNHGGANAQNAYIWSSNANNQNQQWFITPIGGVSAKSLDVIDSDGVVVYPNPVESTTTIQGAAGATMYIYDMNGTVVLSGSLTTDSELIDLSNLSSGVYYAQIDGEKISTVKIIKR